MLCCLSKYNQTLVILTCLSIFSLLLCTSYVNQYSFSQNSTTSLAPSTVKIKNLTIHVDLAVTQDQQEKGLSVKDNMTDNEGMLFPFKTPGDYSFWMKDMKFPLDILWVNSSSQIHHIEKNLQPCTFILFCPSVSPGTHSNSTYVLEVNADYTSKHNINVGDKVNINVVNSTS